MSLDVNEKSIEVLRILRLVNFYPGCTSTSHNGTNGETLTPSRDTVRRQTSNNNNNRKTNKEQSKHK